MLDFGPFSVGGICSVSYWRPQNKRLTQTLRSKASEFYNIWLYNCKKVLLTYLELAGFLYYYSNVVWSSSKSQYNLF